MEVFFVNYNQKNNSKKVWRIELFKDGRNFN